ncbi:hypothetical protein ATANTOWER_004225 [Ataeniobius toweri]|uniref:Uncharacterized protein n=1 Tax=Ataeniobius toweri TaxID=208326 RepID=A0ABU7AEI5_9TELE|nr:hypothetical protein [Ataeniobius toweri]
MHRNNHLARSGGCSRFSPRSDRNVRRNDQKAMSSIQDAASPKLKHEPQNVQSNLLLTGPAVVHLMGTVHPGGVYFFHLFQMVLSFFRGTTRVCGCPPDHCLQDFRVFNDLRQTLRVPASIQLSFGKLG